MAHTYEARVSASGMKLFRDALVKYLGSSGFAHMSIGGRLGAHSGHEFRRGDKLISLNVIPEGQSRFRLVVQSETLPVEPTILAAVSEAVAEFLRPFGEALPDGPPHDTLESLINELRGAFEKTTGDEG